MFTSGFVLIIALTFLFFKLPRKTAFWLLGHHLALDIGVTVLMTIVHWGTFTGLMGAAFAGLMCSLFTSTARWTFGYTERRVFYAGNERRSTQVLDRRWNIPNPPNSPQGA